MSQQPEHQEIGFEDVETVVIRKYPERYFLKGDLFTIYSGPQEEVDKLLADGWTECDSARPDPKYSPDGEGGWVLDPLKQEAPQATPVEKLVAFLKANPDVMALLDKI
jgi:hypothetical protein